MAAEIEKMRERWDQERHELDASSKRAVEHAEAAQRATERELAETREELNAAMEQLCEMQNMLSEGMEGESGSATKGHDGYLAAVQAELDQEREDGEQLRRAVTWMRRRLESTARFSQRSTARQIQLRVFVGLQSHRARRVALREVARKILGRWTQLALATAFEAWSSRPSTLDPTAREQALRTLVRPRRCFSPLGMHVAIASLLLPENVIVPFPNQVSRWKHMSIARAFERWDGLTTHTKTVRRRIGRVLLFWQNRGIEAALRTWTDSILYARRLRHVSSLIIKRWQHRDVAAAFSALSRFCLRQRLRRNVNAVVVSSTLHDFAIPSCFVKEFS
jgi:hypothetical protein